MSCGIKLSVWCVCCLFRSRFASTVAIHATDFGHWWHHLDHSSRNTPPLAFVVLGDLLVLVFCSWKVNSRRWYSTVTKNFGSGVTLRGHANFPSPHLLIFQMGIIIELTSCDYFYHHHHCPWSQSSTLRGSSEFPVSQHWLLGPPFHRG